MSLFNLLPVSASGMQAQRIRAALLTENIANSETSRTPGGGPYRRKDAVFTAEPAGSTFASVLDGRMTAMTGVAVKEVYIDQSEPERKFAPEHPDAGPDGYVALPRLNPAEEMVNLLGAARGYEANVAAMSAAKDMILRSIDLLR
jgi:flagellar basal-body rod protein FlgC